MSKKRGRNKRKEVYDMKSQMTVFAKRYVIILLICMPIIMFINFVLGSELGLSTVAVVFITLAFLLLALFIGIVIFTKRDEKRQQRQNSESSRDPFAD